MGIYPHRSLFDSHQLADENRYLNDELNRVETALNFTRTEKDELSIRYNELSDRVTPPAIVRRLSHCRV